MSRSRKSAAPARSGARPGPVDRPWADRAPEGTRWAVIVLFVATVLPVLWFLHPVGDYFVETDFYGGYAPGVRALRAGDFDPARYGVVGPVYESLLALLSFTGLELFRLAQLVALAATAGTIAVWSAWLERRVGRGVGWIAALLVATNPTVFRYAYTAGTDAVFLFLLTAAFARTFPGRPGAEPPSPAALAQAGALAGLATLTRYTGIVLVPLGLAAAVWPGAGSPWRGRRVRAVVAFTLGVTAILGPWLAYTGARDEAPTLRFYHNLAYEVYARARGITWDAYQLTLEQEFPTFRSVLERDPGAVAGRLAANTGEHLLEAARELWLWPLAVLAAVGAILWAARRAPGLGPPLALGALVYAALVPAFYASRYHLPLVPVAAALAATALAAPRALPALLARARFGATTGLVLACVLAGAVFVSARATWRESAYIATQVPDDLPGVGRALASDWQGEGRPRLMARKPHLSYYADAEPVPFAPLDSLEALVRYVHAERVDYLFVSWPEALLRPSFAFLLVPEFALQGLTLVAAGPNGHSALYRVDPGFGSTLPEWYPREWEWRSGEGMIRIAPTNAAYWFAAGAGRQVRGQLDGALEAFEMALRLQPGWGKAYAGIGNVHGVRGEFAAAAAAYEAALRAGETAPAVLSNLGFACAQLGDLARAEEAMARYVAATGDPAGQAFLNEIRARRAAQ